ncbi:hypothetical protein [Helicobacter trogontum]|uniref:Uncharacterized protein n=1 Tax=Helicobacter trogontum TaxID=50960 RepID=A0A4U8S686_9HELI|nr:hypothetical protein [Helicobacter trogontum]TLD81345.1 hypothetical protein LS81_008525 [Helicobacter trogontum]
MKLLFLFLNILAISLNVNEIYYDEGNTFLNVKPGKEFLQKYFYKPLNTQQQSIIALEIISISRIENIQEICNIFEMHHDKKQDACFDNYGIKFCELKTAKEMQDYMLKFIEIPVKLDHSNYMFMENNICGFRGKVKAFGYIWDFEIRGGGMEFTRKINEKIFSINENPTRAYRQGKIEGSKAKKYFICIESHCNPRAQEIVH